MQIDQAVRLAALAGRTILENGGEIYRVEETAARICHSYGVAGAQVYATPTVLIVSVARPDAAGHTVVERIGQRRVNLDRVDAVNRLARRWESEPPLWERAFRQLEEARQRREHPGSMLVLFSALASAAFTLVFHGSPQDLLPAFLAGALIRLAALGMARIRLNDFFVNLTGGAIASIAGWAAVRTGFGANADIITISALMLLVPGLMITNAVRDIAAGDLISGISRGMEAFFIAVAIACGTALAYLLIPGMGGGLL